MSSLLSRQARSATTSAIRDLLEHAQRPGMISLAGGLPDPARFPVEELATIAERVLRDDGRRVLQYGLTAGERDLRDHIVATTAAAASAEEVVITTGSQQGLRLLAHVLIDPGDRVVVADPEYLGATQAFAQAGGLPVAFPTDADGLDVDAVETALTDGLRPKFVYLVPHFHNPTGATLAAERRRRLFELADRYGFMVLLDDPYRELYIGANAPDEDDPHPMAVHLRSTSKVLAPGLRIGWLIGPAWLTTAVERSKQAVDLHTSTVAQAIVLAALRADWFPPHLDELRAATGEKRDALCRALDDALGERISFTRPGGGMFVWAALEGVDTTTLLAPALERGVAFVPGGAFAIHRDLADHLRLSWATASPDELSEAVSRLAAALDDL
ncbi:MAG: PLP-dependent aminotransferase family protein [Acidimicrobiales bacterium]